VSSGENVITLHEAIDGVESRIAEELNCDAIIHMDPVDLNDQALIRLREALPNIIARFYEKASYHDLRVVRAKGHLNVLFDVLLPAGAMIDKAEATERLNDEVNKVLDGCCCIVNFDTDFTGTV
jgi:hypothetical protein